MMGLGDRGEDVLVVHPPRTVTTDGREDERSLVQPRTMLEMAVLGPRDPQSLERFVYGASNRDAVTAGVRRVIADDGLGGRRGGRKPERGLEVGAGAGRGELGAGSLADRRGVEDAVEDRRSRWADWSQTVRSEQQDVAVGVLMLRTGEDGCLG